MLLYEPLYTGPMHKTIRNVCVGALVLVCLACGGSTSITGLDANTSGLDPANAIIHGQIIADGLTQPMEYICNSADPQNAYVIEKGGAVKLIKNDVLQPGTVLDISGVLFNQGECGLLGIAFDPKFASNRYVYLHYNTGPDPIKTNIVRYTVSGDGTAFSNEFPIFSFEQPTPSHKGGSINFGPDGFLYIATGDGGSPEDIANNAQSPQTFLGKVLRLDVANDDFPNDATQNYAIPRNNPYYTSKTIKQEIWAVGLRNPYRWSFDSKTGAMIIADVGQDKWEELNFIPKGVAQMNFGWRVKEGNEDFFTNLPAFSHAFALPFFQYDHTFGRAIVGGFVYRGNALDASMKGRYVFADATIPKIASIAITLSGGNPLPVPISSAIVHSPSINASLGADSIGAPVSVSPDINGEIMIADLYKGHIIRLVPPPPVP